MKNDVKNHNKTKDNVDEYVEARRNELMGEILRFKYISRVGKETILDNFVRQIINDQKVKVSKTRLEECIEIESFGERYLDLKALMYELGIEITPRIEEKEWIEVELRDTKEKIFVQHIENHLKTMGIKGKVICKICGKDIDTIADEEVTD